MFSARTVGSIAEVKSSDWDDLISDCVLMSHGWLKTVEETLLDRFDRVYVLVEESGRLVGAAVCEYCGSNRFDEILFGRLKGRASRLGISFGPVLDCNPFRSYGKAFLVEKGADPARKTAIIGELYSRIERDAENSGCSIGFSKLMDNEPELIRLLNERGFSRSVSPPLNYIDIEWSTFSDYKRHIASISRNMESNIRKEMNKNKREGVVIQTLDEVADSEGRLFELATLNQLKHNHMPFAFKRDFFSRLKNNLGRDTVFYTAVKGNDLIGLAVMLKRNGKAFTPIVGIDHDLSKNDATYFNICYYKPIQDAIENKISRIYFGYGMYDLKAKRGCSIRPVYIYYRSSNPLRNSAARGWMAVHSAWWGRKSPYNRLRNGEYLHGNGEMPVNSILHAD
jgi:predicted N-acyltransferase